MQRCGRPRKGSIGRDPPGQLADDIRLADGMEIMRKPFPLEELAARVKALLAQRRSGATG